MHSRTTSPLIVYIILGFVILINGCYQEETEKKTIVKNNKAAELLRQQFAGKIEKTGKQKLSEYGFFKSNFE